MGYLYFPFFGVIHVIGSVKIIELEHDKINISTCALCEDSDYVLRDSLLYLCRDGHKRGPVTCPPGFWARPQILRENAYSHNFKALLTFQMHDRATVC